MKTPFQIAKEINALLEENNMGITKHTTYDWPGDPDGHTTLVVVDKSTLYEYSGSPVPGHTIHSRYTNI